MNGIFPYFLAKYKTRNLKNYFYDKKDFMSISYHDINILLCFLIKSLVSEISKKILKELPEKECFFSEIFPLNLPEEKKHTAKTFGFPCAIYQYFIKKG